MEDRLLAMQRTVPTEELGAFQVLAVLPRGDCVFCALFLHRCVDKVAAVE